MGKLTDNTQQSLDSRIVSMQYTHTGKATSNYIEDALSLERVNHSNHRRVNLRKGMRYCVGRERYLYLPIIRY